MKSDINVNYKEIVEQDDFFSLDAMEHNLSKAFDKENVEINPHKLQGMIDLLKEQHQEIRELNSDLDIKRKMPLIKQLKCGARLEGWLSRWWHCKDDECDLCKNFKTNVERIGNVEIIS